MCTTCAGSRPDRTCARMDASMWSSCSTLHLYNCELLPPPPPPPPPPSPPPWPSPPPPAAAAAAAAAPSMDRLPPVLLPAAPPLPPVTPADIVLIARLTALSMELGRPKVLAAAAPPPLVRRGGSTGADAGEVPVAGDSVAAADPALSLPVGDPATKLGDGSSRELVPFAADVAPWLAKLCAPKASVACPSSVAPCLHFTLSVYTLAEGNVHAAIERPVQLPWFFHKR